MNRDPKQTQTRLHLDRTTGRGLSPMIVAHDRRIPLASTLSDFPAPCMSQASGSNQG
jgi:hypothetical protein